MKSLMVRKQGREWERPATVLRQRNRRFPLRRVLPGFRRIGCTVLLAGFFAGDALSQTRQVAIVSAASYAAAPLAPDSIASAFGQGLATATASAQAAPLPNQLAGTSVSLADSRGVARLASLFFVSPGQVNLVVPSETAAGAATVSIRSGDGAVSTASVQIQSPSPGIFTADSTGRGTPAALLLRIAADGVPTTTPLASFDNDRKMFVSEAIDLGAAGDQVYLTLFGTGIRGMSRGVTVTLAGESAPVSSAGPQGFFAGLDQVNVGPLPRSLAGRGEVALALAADEVKANGVTVKIRSAVSPVASGEWGMRAPLAAPNSEIAVAELDGRIYVMGGYPANRVTVTTVQVYDSVTDTWRLTTPLPLPLNHAMAAAAYGKLFVIGGQTTADGGYVDTVFEYDPATAAWTPRARMPTARSAGASAVVDGKIYVAGGRPPRGSDFAVFDPRENTWRVLPDLPTQRNHLGAAAIGGKIYVAGGRFEGGFTSPRTDALEVYDPGTAAWTPGARMPLPRGGVNALEAFGCLHVFGGEGNSGSPSGVFPDHDIYNPATDTWTQVAPMPIPVHGVTGAAFLYGLIYLPGGGTMQGGSSGSTHHQVYRPTLGCQL